MDLGLVNIDFFNHNVSGNSIIVLLSQLSLNCFMFVPGLCYLLDNDVTSNSAVGF